MAFKRESVTLDTIPEIDYMPVTITATELKKRYADVTKWNDENRERNVAQHGEWVEEQIKEITKKALKILTENNHERTQH